MALFRRNRSTGKYRLWQLTKCRVGDKPWHRRTGSGDAGHPWCRLENPLDELLREYLPILVFLGVAAGLGLALVLAAVVIAVRNPYAEKVSAYECGFNAFDDARMKFDVRFYLVAILFIIFDLEVAFLFPWAASFKTRACWDSGQ